jgi:hypothetical protein
MLHDCSPISPSPDDWQHAIRLDYSDRTGALRVHESVRAKDLPLLLSGTVSLEASPTVDLPTHDPQSGPALKRAAWLGPERPAPEAAKRLTEWQTREIGLAYWALSGAV